MGANEVLPVAIIIVNWNRVQDVIACLDSLAQIDYPRTEVIVVDNASSDGSAAAIRAQFPQVVLLECATNLGFVEGNNLGLRVAADHGAEYALLLNNDTLVAPDFLSRLVTAAQANPAAAVLGPTIYYASYPNVIWAADGWIDWAQGFPHMPRMDQEDCGQLGTAARAVDYVTGCALLVKLSIVAAVGPLDPRFFAYFEEVEWCVRIAKAGHQILYVPEAKVWHKIGRDERAASPSVHYYMTRNRLLFLKLCGAGWQAWVYVLQDYLRTMLAWRLKPKWRDKQAHSAAMRQGIHDYFYGKFGKREG